MPDPMPLYTYDALNRLSTVTDATGHTTTYGYDPVGNRASVSYPNGNITTYTYDSLNRLTVLETKDTTDTIIVRYAYTLAATGHRTQVTDHTGATTSYSYDDLYRLTGEDLTQHPALGSQSNSYEYDPVGNRIFSIENGIHTAYSYDANDRLLTAGGQSYSYDANGNTLTVVIDTTLTTYDYDANNRLIQMIKTENGIETDNVSYQYDIDGLRVAKNDDGITTSYLVDKHRDYGQVIKELDGNNQEIVGYTYGDDLISQDRSGVESFYLYDGLGSTRSLTDSLGNVTDTYDYNAYGTLIDSTGSTRNSYLYTGEQFDGSLNNYYLRARYYTPSIGRFTQMDTWMGNSSNPITLHKYAYGNLDPVNTIDPSGNFGLIEFGVVNNIRMELMSIQVDVGFSLLDAAISSDNPNVGNNSTANGIFMLGVAGGKIASILSKKARQLCPTSASNCVRALFGRIKTPHSIAKQLDSPEAWAALERAQSGAPLYRMGTLGRSRGSEAQFWSLTDPRDMSPSDFADYFGIPKENENFDFMIVGRLSPGKMAITRQAPGVDNNSGGGIEVVVNPNSVMLDFFHIP